MRLTPLSDDVAQRVLPPRSFINAYLVGDVPVDAGMGMHARAIVKDEPPGLFTADAARNRESPRRLAELEPQLGLFGHRRPLREPAKLSAFVRSPSPGA